MLRMKTTYIWVRHMIDKFGSDKVLEMAPNHNQQESIPHPPVNILKRRDHMAVTFEVILECKKIS